MRCRFPRYSGLPSEYDKNADPEVIESTLRQHLAKAVQYRNLDRKALWAFGKTYRCGHKPGYFKYPYLLTREQRKVKS